MLMYQNVPVPSKNNKQKYLGKKTFFGISSATDEKSRIRILKSVVRIRESGFVPKCHGSTTLIISVRFLLGWRVGDSSFFWNTAAAVSSLTGMFGFVAFVKCF
jgi:hypothetical protein